MLKRHFVSSSRLLKSTTQFAPVYAKLLNHECFKPLLNKLPAKYEQLDPFDLSRSINEMLANSSIAADQISMIHNKLIEELSPYEYGISTLHAKKLEQSGAELSEKSLLQIIKNNPGRVHDSWEILMQCSRDRWTDDLLVAVLENTISTKTLKENDKSFLPLKYLSQCVLLAANISNKELLNPQVLNSLLDNILDEKVTDALHIVLKCQLAPLSIFSARIDDLTPGQIYQMYKHFPLDTLAANKNLFSKVLYTLGTNKSIPLSQEEINANQELLKYLGTFLYESKLCDSLVRNENINSPNVQEDYLHLKNYIAEKRMDHHCFTLAKIILRIEGVYKDDMSQALELYHSYLLSYQNRADELMFEIFLSFASQSYKLSDPILLEYAQAFISADYTAENVSNTVRILILANCKFDVEKSLQIYNSNIETFIKREDSTLSSGAVTESLILAYLANEDLDFARVVFDGAVKERVLLEVTSKKHVKALFKLYGEAAEENKAREVMSEEIIKFFQTV